MTLLRVWTVGGIWLTVCFLGCGGQNGPEYRGERVPVHPVSGKITLAGHPIKDAQLVFHPIDPNYSLELRPRARSQADGSFQVTTYETHDGAPIGNYRVTVSWQGPLDGVKYDDQDALPERLPTRYQNPGSSGLSVEVSTGVNQIPPFDLKR